MSIFVRIGYFYNYQLLLWKLFLRFARIFKAEIRTFVPKSRDFDAALNGLAHDNAN